MLQKIRVYVCRRYDQVAVELQGDSIGDIFQQRCME